MPELKSGRSYQLVLDGIFAQMEQSLISDLFEAFTPKDRFFFMHAQLVLSNHLI